MMADHTNSYTGPKLVDGVGAEHHRDGEELRALFHGVAATTATNAPPETNP
jgi:hypothetical protein